MHEPSSTSPASPFGTRYDGSPLIAADGTTPPPDAANVYVPTATPGGRAPHVWLGDGRSLFDRLGFDFTLLRLGPQPPSAAPFAAAARSAGIPLQVVEIAAVEVRELYGADLVLLRPDQIVAWRGSTPPAEAPELLARLTGH